MEPLALDVVGIGGLPVRRAGQRDANDAAVGANHPHVARSEVEIDVPNLVGLRHLRMRPAAPAGNALRAGNRCLAPAPSWIAGQADRTAGLAGLANHQFAAIRHAALEDIGVDALGRSRAGASERIPRMVLPGLLARAGVGVAASFVVDVTNRVARRVDKRLRFPLQVAGRQHSDLGILPRPGRPLAGGRQRAQGGSEKHATKPREMR